MLAATVARHFEHFHLAAASQGDVDGSDSPDNSHAINITSPGYHLLSNPNFTMAPPAVNYQQLVAPGSASQQQSQQQPQSRQQQQQGGPALAIPGHDAQHSLYNSEMTYLGQTLIPSGYPILPPTQHRPSFQHSPSSGYSSSGYDGRPLQGWASSSPGADASQPPRQFFDEYQQQHQGLQAGSRSSLSSTRASMDLSAQQQQHIVYTQQQQRQHSPQSEYILGLQQQQQHHHHHSLPTQSPTSNAHNHDYSDSSSRERELGGAPNMVGLEGMPEPAPRPKGPKLKFTRADDALLIELKEGKNLTWKQIADFFPGRSSGTLQVRYCTKLKAKTTVWTDEMVQRLRNAMAEYENDRWRIIASKVGQGFSAVACQDRALELEIEEAGGSFMMGELDEEEEYSGSNATAAASQQQ